MYTGFHCFFETLYRYKCWHSKNYYLPVKNVHLYGVQWSKVKEGCTVFPMHQFSKISLLYININMSVSSPTCTCVIISLILLNIDIHKMGFWELVTWKTYHSLLFSWNWYCWFWLFKKFLLCVYPFTPFHTTLDLYKTFLFV